MPLALRLSLTVAYSCARSADAFTYLIGLGTERAVLRDLLVPRLCASSTLSLARHAVLWRTIEPLMAARHQAAIRLGTGISI